MTRPSLRELRSLPLYNWDSRSVEHPVNNALMNMPTEVRLSHLPCNVTSCLILVYNVKKMCVCARAEPKRNVPAVHSPLLERPQHRSSTQFTE